jgi:hypothetical protein
MISLRVVAKRKIYNRTLDAKREVVYPSCEMRRREEVGY